MSPSRVRHVLAACVIAMALLAPVRPAMAQGAASAYVVAVDLDVDPAHLDEFKTAIEENGAASVREPGCRRFDILTLGDNPSHVFLYEVYESEDAYKAHRASDHFKHYAATTATWVKARTTRPMIPLAMNAKSR